MLADMTARSCVRPEVHRAARLLTMGCDARNDVCEIESIFNAVKEGDPRVKGLERGVRYVNDPLVRDYFLAPHKLLEACEAGACAEDCDSQAALLAGLLASIGFEVGLRAWGKPNERYYQHVYCVVVTPKSGKGKRRTVSLDSTVPTAYVGWAPPKGRVLTAWIHRNDLDNSQED